METEKEIVDLIVRTLGEGEEQYILGSWESFAKKRRDKKRLILWFWSTGIAAGLIVGWLGFRLVFTGSFVSNADSALQHQIVSNLDIKADKKGSEEPLLINKESGLKPLTGVSGMTTASAVSQANKGRVIIVSTTADSNNKQEIKVAELKSDTAGTHLPVTGNLADHGNSVKIDHKSDTSLNNKAITQNNVRTEIKDQDIQPEKIRSHKFRFGVNFAPGVATSASASAFNYSGGVNADYELSKRFRISTGLQLEHQNVTNESMTASAWMPADKTQAMLTDLDLPLNITWKFLIKKSACYYISSGISTVAYLGGRYTTISYSQKMMEVVNMVGGQPNVTYQLETVAKTDQKSDPALSTLDFAGRVNIMFGYEQHLSSKLFLHIEPYLKIPVTDLGSQNLKFTTSGITCKISF